MAAAAAYVDIDVHSVGSATHTEIRADTGSG
jgi:hypothetical protein